MVGLDEVRPALGLKEQLLSEGGVEGLARSGRVVEVKSWIIDGKETFVAIVPPEGIRKSDVLESWGNFDIFRSRRKKFRGFGERVNVTEEQARDIEDRGKRTLATLNR